MKRTIVTLILIAGMGISGTVFAHKSGKDKSCPMMSADQKLEKMSKSLKLSDEQKAKLKPILDEKTQKMEAVHKQAQEIYDATDAQISGILNDEQKKKFEKRSHRKESRKSCCTD